MPNQSSSLLLKALQFEFIFNILMLILGCNKLSATNFMVVAQLTMIPIISLTYTNDSLTDAHANPFSTMVIYAECKNFETESTLLELMLSTS